MKNINLKVPSMDSIPFELIPINLINKDIDKVYLKDKRTLGYALAHEKYIKANEIFGKAYADQLHMKLGAFVDELILSNNISYQLILNRYGHEKFCHFKIDKFLNKKGLYCFLVNGEVKYLGKCTTSFKQRINDGYGRISARNCYKDGQATNCHINKLLNDQLGQIYMGIYDMSRSSKADIDSLERALLLNNFFSWNIQLRQKDFADQLIQLELTTDCLTI